MCEVLPRCYVTPGGAKDPAIVMCNTCYIVVCEAVI